MITLQPIRLGMGPRNADRLLERLRTIEGLL